MIATPRLAVEVDEDLEAKYEIFGELGGGGMGRVLRARHRQLKRWVAIKLLHTDLRGSESVARFLREARAAAHIRSVHVAQVMDAGILRGGRPYIVMEYLQGQDLARLVASRGRLPVEEAVDYMLQALDALAEAHSLQIIHRDIKPGNLFATELAGGDIAIKIVDFGLAKSGGITDSLDPTVTERGAVLGTPSYMSPEQFTNSQDVDARTDIWGIGATLFELLTGTPPFTGTSLPQVYSAVMHGPLPTLRSVIASSPEALERVVARCLTRAREERYASVAELASGLAPFAGTSAIARVDRIRRVLSTVRTSHDLELLPSECISRLDALPARDTRVGAISSTFEREPTRERADSPFGDAPQRRPRRKLVVLSLAAALVAAIAIALWGYGRAQRGPARPVEVAPVSVQARPPMAVGEPSTPPIPLSPAPLAEKAETPAPEAKSVTPATTENPMRVKAKPRAPKPRLKASIYEQYP